MKFIVEKEIFGKAAERLLRRCDGKRHRQQQDLPGDRAAFG